jgi:16S rRNA (guanine(966)-N(2))-methyltransferase RsmD
MRIIAGVLRSRHIFAPKGFTTRPMPDRVRESVFAMLGARVEAAQVADLFAGSGAIGIEAISRGAAGCLFVEQDRRAAEVLENNLDRLGVADRGRVVLGDALGASVPFRLPRPVDLIFLDPPYPLVRQPAGWNRVRDACTRLAPLLAPDGFLILRTPWPFMLETGEAEGQPEGESRPGPRRFIKSKKYKREPYRPDRAERDDRPERAPRDRARGAGGGGGEREDRRGKKKGRAGEAAAPEPGEIEGLGVPIDPETLEPLDPRVRHEERRAARHAGAPEPGDEHDEPVGEDAEDAPVDAEDGGEELIRVSGTGEAVPRTPGELTIAGLRGPETHAYGKTAVHWYMRADQPA